MNEAVKSSVAVFGLGGTIAMTQTTGGGVSPALSAPELLAAVPGLSDVEAGIRAVDFRQKPGASLSFGDLFELVTAINDALAGGCTGVVVTQGTDTIEEVAYALDLLLPTDAPVVVTGAMRNPTMAGADGPANILAAVRVALSPRARGLGCLVVLNDQIHAARWVRKTHTGSTAAFASPGHGPLGEVVEGHVRIPIGIRHRSPALHPDPAREVRVGVATVVLGDDGRLIEAIGAHVDGLVVAAFGVGHVPAGVVPVLAGLAERIPVVLASRVGAGPVHDSTYAFPGSERDLLARGLISAGYLDPLKARILLHLLVASGADPARIRDTFAAGGGLAEPDD
ncbi:MAG TPA: asparaginase [Streptosporangiaceae bacterium]|jgi:L-asparaginase